MGTISSSHNDRHAAFEELRAQLEPMRVIVADDDPFARRMLKEALQRADVIVIAEAHNGYEAVELCLH